MKKSMITVLSVVVVLSLAAVSQGDVVYQSDFTGTTLASAGLAVSPAAAGGGWAIDDPNDQLDGTGGGNARASVYTTSSWQNDGGFILEVTFWGSSALIRHSFGIVDANFNIAGTSSDWLNQSLAGAYGIGFSTAGGGADGLYFNNDAGTLTPLSTAQGDKTSAAAETMTIIVTATSWSYSLNGAPPTTGSHTFDTSRNYRFIAYAQRASRANFQNITLSPPIRVWDGSTDTDWSADPDSTSWSGATYNDGDTVHFNGAGGTVNITEAVNPHCIFVNDGGTDYDFTDGGGSIGGAGTLTKTGTGTLTINNANTYTGGTTLNSGALIVGNSEAIGTGTLTLNGGTLRNNTAAVTLNEAIVVSGTTAVFTASTTDNLGLTGDITGAGTLNLGGSGSGQGSRYVSFGGASLNGFTGTISFENVAGGNMIIFGSGANTAAKLQLSGTTGGQYFGFQQNATFGELSGTGGRIISWNRYLTINQDTDTSYGGVLLDVNTNNELGFTKGGTGRLTLTNTGNSYEFATTVNGGTLEVQGRINETASITVASGATFEVTGSGSLGAGGVYAGGGSGSGNIINSGTFEYNSTTDQTLSGVISGTGVLVKDNTSTLTLSGANTYSGGTTLNSGALDIAHADSALGTGALTLAGGTLNNTSALANNQLDVDIVASGTNAVFAGSGGNLTLNGGVSGAGTLNFGGSGSGQGNKAVNVYLSDLSGFTGTIRHDAVSNGNYLYFGQGGATVNTTAKLETTGLTGGNRYIRFFANATFGELSGTGGRIISKARLTIDQDTDTTYAGRMSNIQGGMSFTKAGTGSLTLSGANDYTVSTIVSGGALLVDGSIASPTTVNNTATLGGSGSIGGAVTVNSAGHIAPGASIGTITMAAGLTLSDGSILDIEADAAGAADKILLTGGTFTGATSADGVTLNVTFSGTPKQGAYTLIDWSSAAGESGVDLADFDLVLTAPASGIHDLVIVDQTLLLTVVQSSVFSFR